MSLGPYTQKYPDCLYREIMQESVVTSLPSVAIILLLLATSSFAARLRHLTSSQTCDALSLPRGCFCHQYHSVHLEVNCHDLTLTQMPKFGPAPGDETITIESIHITRSSITEIGNVVFREIAVKKLYLPHNRLWKIDNQAFVHSTETLVHLDLSHNHLSKVPEAIKNLRALKTMDLTGNDIHVVDWAIFQNLGQNRGSLYLHQNPIQRYRHEPESNFPLKKLVISLKDFQDDPLVGLDIFWAIPQHACSSLEFLLLTDTPVSSVKIKQRRFPNIRFFGLERGSVTADTLKKDSFRTVGKQLRGLSLAKNFLTRVPSGALNRLKKLEHLDLSHNFITSIRDLSKLPSLKTVDFSGNRISMIWHAAMALPSLEFVDLSNNELTTLLPGAIPISQLTRFSIRENPWQCSCDTRWLIELIQRDVQEGEGPFSTAEMFRQSDGVRCSDDALVIDFDLRDLECSDYNITGTRNHTAV